MYGSDTIYKTVEAIKEDVLALFQLILESDYGWNNKVNKNTLHDSKLYEDASVNMTRDFRINLFYNDYLEYIERGRPIEAPKVPVKALFEWARRKGLPTDNQFIYAVRESIYKKGIRPRPILKPFSDEMDKLWDDWSEQLFQAITNNLDKFFNK